jgi:hypothetical protein
MSEWPKMMTQEDVNVLAAVANKQCLTELMKSAMERGFDHVPIFVIVETIKGLDTLIADPS